MCQLPSREWTFENFDHSGPLREAYSAATELAEEKGNVRWLTLMGGIDTGKSHLAVAICRRWLARYKPARYVLVPLMLDDLRAGYDQHDFDRQLKFLMDVPLLVLDDLGVGSVTPWASEKLMEIVDHRYLYRLAMVVTTNKALDDLPGDLEHRIGSRIMRAEFSRIIYIDAPEYRLRRGKKNATKSESG